MLVESFQNMYPDLQSIYDTPVANHNNTNIDSGSAFDIIHRYQDYYFLFFFVFINGLRRFNFLDDDDFRFDFF